jgi:molybdopterin-guanine dinucleotide biosynthesis protein
VLLTSEREQTRRMNEELRAAAVQEAHRTVEDARTKTREILEQGERQMALLHGQREQLITRLNTADQELHRALSGLLSPSEPTPSD